MNRLTDWTDPQLRSPLPRCAVCNKTVDLLTQTYDNTRCRTILTAHCHGEKEVVELDDELLHDADRIGIADAFVRRELPGAPRRLGA